MKSHGVPLSVFHLCLALSLFGLAGCGSQFKGTLPGSGGNTGPAIPDGQAEIDMVSPISISAGSPSFTLTVTGKNFSHNTSVLWDNNNALTTTYVSSTELQAQVPAAYISSPHDRRTHPFARGHVQLRNSVHNFPCIFGGQQLLRSFCDPCPGQ